jgi:hypothetical protein
LWERPGAYLRVVYLKNALLRQVPDLPTNISLKKLARDKYSSLLRTFISYQINKFITLVHGPNVIKLYTAVIY